MKALSASIAVCGLAALTATSAQADPRHHYGYGYQTTGYNYSDNCKRVRGNQGVGGAVIGGVLGGLAGFGLAGNEGVEDEGAALGALVGAIAGSEITKSSTKCGPKVYGPRGPVHAGHQPVYTSGELYGGRDRDYEPYRHRDYSDYGYGRDDDYYERSYGRRDALAAKECESVMRVTRMPDGREIHEPVTVCREAYYGDWDLRD